MLTGLLSIFPLLVSANPYGEVLFGQSNQKPGLEGVSGSSKSDTMIGLRGGFQFHENFSAEISWEQYGEASWTYYDAWNDLINETMKSDALKFGVKGMLPFNEKTSFIGRVGMAKWGVDYEYTDSSLPGQVAKASTDGMDVYFSFGAEYKVNEDIYFGAEYSMLTMKDKVLGYDIENDVTTTLLYIGSKF